MTKRVLTGTIAGLIIVVALAAALWFIYEWPPRFDRKPHAAIGWVLARQALGLVKDGASIIVITRDTETFPQPALEIQLASFLKTLNAADSKEPILHKLQVDPLRPVEVPPGDFFEWIRRAPPGSVIVSFMGPPLLTDAQRQRLQEIKPRILAFCTGHLPHRSYLKVLFDQGLLHAAVIERPPTAISTLKPKDMKGWFDRHFLLVTPSNISLLSDAESSRKPAPSEHWLKQLAVKLAGKICQT